MAVKKEKNNNEINSEIQEEKFNLKKFLTNLISISLIVISIIFLVLFFPTITLIGDAELTISYNEIYQEPGYKGYIFNKDISKDIDVVSNLNNNALGDYEINYYYNMPGARVKKSRIIHIVDNVSPIINVDKNNIEICPNDELPVYTYEAIDEYDGNITNKVIEEVNDHEIVLSVKDTSSNETTLTIPIDRVDKEPPVINLKGNQNIYLSYGNAYYEPGYTATDNCSKDLTNKVTVTGSVGRNIGTYSLTYSVTDESGNTTSVTRKIVIQPNFVDNGTIHNGTIYLTFDDGPSQGTTNQILDILKEEGIKATFFVTCKGPDYLIKRMHDEGHTVALHTAYHDYEYIYSKTENYFNDLNQVKNRVKNITGIESKIVRFPGGSSNAISRNYRQGIMTELSGILLNDGYRYFDWNVDGKDAGGARNSADVYYNVTSSLSPHRANVVLLHDIKSITVGALRDIIKFGKEYGYTFSEITMDTYMVRHKIIN